jgi:RNA polymerase sigma-70 factor, ECF subfamily
MKLPEMSISMPGEPRAGEATSPFLRQLLAYREQLLAYIRTIAGPDLAEDIFQQVTVVLLQQQDTLSAEGDFHAWCRSVARNLAWRERTRSRRLRAIKDEQLLDLVDEALSELPSREDLNHRKTLLTKCTEKLSEANRQLLAARYTQGMSLRELSASLNRPEGSLQVTLFRIRKALQECMQRLGGGNAK